jgi:hypothetical protein
MAWTTLVIAAAVLALVVVFLSPDMWSNGVEVGVGILTFAAFVYSVQTKAEFYIGLVGGAVPLGISLVTYIVVASKVGVLPMWVTLLNAFAIVFTAWLTAWRSRSSSQ